MKKSKRLIASFLAVMMLMAVVIVPAAMATPRLTNTPIKTIFHGSGTLGVHASSLFHLRSGASLYMERSNGTSIQDIARGARIDQSVSTNLLPSANMVIIIPTVWGFS